MSKKPSLIPPSTVPDPLKYWAGFLLKALNRMVRFVMGGLQQINPIRSQHTKTVLLMQDSNRSMRDEILKRLAFYQETEDPAFVEQAEIPASMVLSKTPILVAGTRSKFTQWMVISRPGTFEVDFTTNPMDGWAWTAYSQYQASSQPDLRASKARFIEYVNRLSTQQKTCCYVFGTGPSLEKAIDRQWNDGYRIVCNTIVRDPDLWDHIHPDFIVAGDAIYHFGFTSFARAFRVDLHKRLQASQTMFIYPDRFHSIVYREFSDLEGQLIPIPTGWRKRIDVDLTRDFHLPNLGNVLGLLLLPVACTITKRVKLWGFDGRAPVDKLFWSNSPKHSYPEHMDELQRAHPKFFSHYVPESDPTRYVKEVHGDELDRCLSDAEKRGFSFEMMHTSWTPTLQKRYHGENQNGV